MVANLPTPLHSTPMARNTLPLPMLTRRPRRVSSNAMWRCARAWRGTSVRSTDGVDLTCVGHYLTIRDHDLSLSLSLSHMYISLYVSLSLSHLSYVSHIISFFRFLVSHPLSVSLSRSCLFISLLSHLSNISYIISRLSFSLCLRERARHCGAVGRRGRTARRRSRGARDTAPGQHSRLDAHRCAARCLCLSRHTRAGVLVPFSETSWTPWSGVEVRRAMIAGKGAHSKIPRTLQTIKIEFRSNYNYFFS